MKRDEKEKHYSWELDPIIAETKRLEMQILLHESNEMFRMLRQAKKEHPEAPGCEEEAE